VTHTSCEGGNTRATPVCPPHTSTLHGAHGRPLRTTHYHMPRLAYTPASRSPRLPGTLLKRSSSTLWLQQRKSPHNRQSHGQSYATGAIHANQSDDLGSCLVCIWRTVLASSPARSKVRADPALLPSLALLSTRSEARPRDRPPHPSPSLPRTQLHTAHAPAAPTASRHA